MGRLITLFRVAYRNVWRNPRRSILTLLAVALGVWSSVSLASIARGLSYGMVKNAIHTLLGHIQIHAPGYLDDPSIDKTIRLDEHLGKALRHPLISTWAPRIRVPAVIMSERESFAIEFVGVNPLKERGLSFIGDGVSSGRDLSDINDSGLIVGEKLLEILETEIGKRVVVISQNASGEIADRGFRIVGSYKAKLEATEKAFIFTGLSTAQKMLQSEGKISEISILLTNESYLNRVTSALKAALPNYDIRKWKEIKPLIGAILKLQGNFLYLWFFIVVIALSIGLINTLFMSLFERTREIGLMQALGLRPRGIVLEVLFESLVLLMIGTIIGNLLAFFTFIILSDGLDISMFAAGAAHIGFENIVYPVFLFNDWCGAHLLILGLCMLSSIYPAWKASRYAPAEALAKG